jgi:hypothetical protein
MKLLYILIIAIIIYIVYYYYIQNIAYKEEPVEQPKEPKSINDELNEVSKLKNELQIKKDTLNKSGKTDEGTIDQIKNLEETIKNLEEIQATYEEIIETKEITLTDSQNQIQEKEGEIQEKDNVIQEKDDTILKLKEEIEQLKTSDGLKISEIDELNVAIDILESEKEDIQTDKENLEQEKKDLEETNETLKNEKDSTVNELKQKILDLEEQVQIKSPYSDINVSKTLDIENQQNYIIKTFHNKYLQLGGNGILNGSKPGPIESTWTWEVFQFIKNNDGTFYIYNPYFQKYILFEENGNVKSIDNMESASKISLLFQEDNYYIKTPFNTLLTAETNDTVTHTYISDGIIPSWATLNRLKLVKYNHDIHVQNPLKNINKNFIIKTHHNKYLQMNRFDVNGSKPGPIEYGKWTWEVFKLIKDTRLDLGSSEGKYYLYSPFWDRYAKIRDDEIITTSNRNDATSFNLVFKHSKIYLKKYNRLLHVFTDNKVFMVDHIDVNNIPNWATFEQFDFIEYPYEITK